MFSVADVQPSALPVYSLYPENVSFCDFIHRTFADEDPGKCFGGPDTDFLGMAFWAITTLAVLIREQAHQGGRLQRSAQMVLYQPLVPTTGRQKIENITYVASPEAWS